MENTELRLYGPKNDKDLKRQYPELANVVEFQKLTVGELLFVWWYANPTSPLVLDDNMPEKERVGGAYAEAFKSSHNESRKIEYYSFNFPDRIRLAIDRMKKYNPSIRARSKTIIETILSNYEKMVKVDMKDFETISIDKEGKETKEINWTGRNNYVTSAAKISETLPQLISQVEEGFGITESKNGEESSTKAIHRFHTSNKD